MRWVRGIGAQRQDGVDIILVGEVGWVEFGKFILVERGGLWLGEVISGGRGSILWYGGGSFQAGLELERRAELSWLVVNVDVVCGESSTIPATLNARLCFSRIVSVVRKGGVVAMRCWRTILGFSRVV